MYINLFANTVKRLNDHQLQTRRVAAWTILGILVLLWTKLVLFAGDLAAAGARSVPIFHPTKGMKIVYIITSSREYNTGERETKEGQDRLMEILVPALLDGIETMVPFYQVGVYLILGYKLSDERRRVVQDLLPVGVRLQVWDQATPLSYELLSQYDRKQNLSDAVRILSRQHRYVIKDKLPNYDFFMAWEDDMLIKKIHIDYYLQFREEIRRLKGQVAEPSSPREESSSNLAVLG